MGHIRRILVPVDGSPSSTAGLSQAVTLANDLGASIEAIRVSVPDEFVIGSAAETSKDAEEQALQRAEEAISAAKGQLGDRLAWSTIPGEVVRAIVEAATSKNADLIVMGTRGRVGRLRELAGSVAENVVRTAPCPVMVVRHSGGEEESFSERVHGRSAVAEQVRPRR